MLPYGKALAYGLSFNNLSEITFLRRGQLSIGNSLYSINLRFQKTTNFTKNQNKKKQKNKLQQKPLLVFLGKGFTNTLKSPDDLFSPAGMLIVTIRFTFISTWPKVLNWVYLRQPHCVKSARIRSFSGRCFPAFGLNTDQANIEYGQFLRTANKICHQSSSVWFKPPFC